MIIIDDREPLEIKDKIENKKIERLEVGDYIIGDFLIERKSNHDFINSILSKRLWIQLSNMKHLEDYKSCLIIIENLWKPFANKKINYGDNMIFGAFRTIIQSYQIPILQFENNTDFILFLKICDKKKNKKKDFLPLPKKKTISIDDKKIMSLSYIEGISIKSSKKLLENFGSIKNISNIDESEFLKLEGIGKKLAGNIHRFFNI